MVSNGERFRAMSESLDHSLDHMTQWQCRKCGEVLWDDDEHDCGGWEATAPITTRFNWTFLLFWALYFTVLATITIFTVISCG